MIRVKCIAGWRQSKWTDKSENQPKTEAGVACTEAVPLPSAVLSPMICLDVGTAWVASCKSAEPKSFWSTSSAFLKTLWKVWACITQMFTPGLMTYLECASFVACTVRISSSFLSTSPQKLFSRPSFASVMHSWWHYKRLCSMRWGTV